MFSAPKNQCFFHSFHSHILAFNVGQLQEVLNGWDEGAVAQQSDDFIKVQLNKVVFHWEQTGALQLAGVVDRTSIATRNAKLPMVKISR